MRRPFPSFSQTNKPHDQPDIYIASHQHFFITYEYILQSIKMLITYTKTYLSLTFVLPLLPHIKIRKEEKKEKKKTNIYHAHNFVKKWGHNSTSFSTY